MLINGGGGKSQGFANFVFPQLGKLVQDLSRRHSFCDRGLQGPNRDPGPAYARHPPMIRWSIAIGSKVMHQYCGPPEAVMGRRTWSLHWSARLKGGCANTGQPH